jgi:hypothetical protein
VATRYKEVSGEVELRDCHDLKRHFTTSKSLSDNGILTHVEKSVLMKRKGAVPYLPIDFNRTPDS